MKFRRRHTWGWAKLMPPEGVLLVGFLVALSLRGQAAEQGQRAGLPCPDSEVVRYTAYRAGRSPVIDGRLDEAVWLNAPKTSRYVDILSGAPTRHETRATILWDDLNLYLGIQVEEPMVRASFTTNNSPIYQDNDVEVFIAGPDAYYEFEVNAFNTTYEVLFFWESSWRNKGFAARSELSSSVWVPFNGVDFKTHPRGARLGNFDWHFPGKKTAVWVDGTVNNDRDRDRGWSVELAFPWAGMKWLATDGRSLPPKEGDVWRIDLSRFNQYKEAVPAKDSGGWVLSPHRVWDSHIPECFPYIRFSKSEAPGVVK